MNEYDMIYEELCERVECGELTLEEAELINDVAYDRYISEGNAFNKLVNYHADGVKRGIDKDDPNGVRKWGNHVQPRSLRTFDRDTVEPFRASMLQQAFTDRKAGDAISRDLKRDYKQEWMRYHGNTGKTPEERYKAGRYIR